MDTIPLWLDTVPKTDFPRLTEDLRVDVLVIGAGITGLTAAYLLRKTGKSVAVLDRNKVGGGETGHTTAHLTYVTDVALTELESRFGRDHARAAWDAGFSAIEQIRTIVEKAGIDCELRTIPGFLMAPWEGDLEKGREQIRKEVELANELGFDVSFVEHTPVGGRPGMRVPNIAKFHPGKYILGMAGELINNGGFIFEKAEPEEFLEDSNRVVANGRTITFEHVILATHVPIQGQRNALSAALLQTKLAAYSTYAIEALAPAGTLPEIMWWESSDPYLYLRVDRSQEHDRIIFGGEDHKTGQERETECHFHALEEKLLRIVPKVTFAHRWSGQVLETTDGLPYIGQASDRQFLSTGYAGNGMTFGTLGGMMAFDWVQGFRNPWSDLFDIHRKKLSATWDYLSENADYPWYLAKGHLSRAEKGSLKALAAGEGKILRIDGHKCAAYRDNNGVAHLLSATCPHLGCTVTWNDAEKTWDCPCHGSRFLATGEVIGGPAEKGLDRKQNPEVATSQGAGSETCEV